MYLHEPNTGARAERLLALTRDRTRQSQETRPRPPGEGPGGSGTGDKSPEKARCPRPAEAGEENGGRQSPPVLPGPPSSRRLPRARHRQPPPRAHWPRSGEGRGRACAVAEGGSNSRRRGPGGAARCSVCARCVPPSQPRRGPRSAIRLPAAGAQRTPRLPTPSPRTPPPSALLTAGSRFLPGANGGAAPSPSPAPLAPEAEAGFSPVTPYWVCGGAGGAEGRTRLGRL